VIGLPFIERARSLGVNLIASHRGISNRGGYDSAGSPADVVRAAKAFSDVRFLIYHSGWEQGQDEDHGYDPTNPSPLGVDRLIRALEENEIGPNGNVYGELGSTWFNTASTPPPRATRSLTTRSIVCAAPTCTIAGSCPCPIRRATKGRARAAPSSLTSRARNTSASSPARGASGRAERVHSATPAPKSRPRICWTVSPLGST
jgi:hypothetical protein